VVHNQWSLDIAFLRRNPSKKATRPHVTNRDHQSRCPNHQGTIVTNRPLVESSCEERNYRQLDRVQHPSYPLFAVAAVTSCHIRPGCLLQKLVKCLEVSENGRPRNLPKVIKLCFMPKRRTLRFAIRSSHMEVS